TQALVRAIAYENTDTDDPTAGGRTVRFTIADGDGGTSNPTDVTMTVTAVNDAPTLTATGANPNWTETTAAPLLFSATAISTVEAGQTIIVFTLTVTNALATGEELIQVDGVNIFLTDGANGTTGPNSLDFNVSFSGSTATLVFSGGTMSVADA